MTRVCGIRSVALIVSKTQGLRRNPQAKNCHNANTCHTETEVSKNFKM